VAAIFAGICCENMGKSWWKMEWGEFWNHNDGYSWVNKVGCKEKFF
jgi:hypothetical protein